MSLELVYVAKLTSDPVLTHVTNDPSITHQLVDADLHSRVVTKETHELLVALPDGSVLTICTTDLSHGQRVVEHLGDPLVGDRVKGVHEPANDAFRHLLLGVQGSPSIITH